MGDTRTPSAHLEAVSTNHTATDHSEIVTRLFIFYMKTVSAKTYTFHYSENYVNDSHDCPTKRGGSSLKDLVVQQISRIIQVVKYNLCPPSLDSRVLLSWQLVDHYLYESTANTLPCLLPLLRNCR